MKKIASLMGAGALVLAMAIPAFAYDRHQRFSDDTRLSNYARVTNEVEVVADSGDNEIDGFFVTRGRISTGTATALGDVLTEANYNKIGCNDCNGDLSVRNRASVRNEVEVRADSGDNEIDGGFVGGGRIRTGAARGDGIVTTTVNTNIVGD